MKYLILNANTKDFGMFKRASVILSLFSAINLNCLDREAQALKDFAHKVSQHKALSSFVTNNRISLDRLPMLLQDKGVDITKDQLRIDSETLRSLRKVANKNKKR